jgi:tRNA 5-methylaminomethyl-2-thiouridine biosynthesis bifunctional protein
MSFDDGGALLVGNDLPMRWRALPAFVILSTAFGDGRQFLAAWQAWRDDPERCAHLTFIAIAAQVPSAEDLATLGSHWPALADALRIALPPSTPDFHSLRFDEGRVELLLAIGTVNACLRALVAEVDAFWLVAETAMPDDLRLGKALGRLAARGATLAAHDFETAWSSSLQTAGFVREPTAGAGRSQARFEPAFAPLRRRRVSVSPPPDRHATVVGAGLAGCAAAWALATRGWRSTLLDRRELVATETSGNPAGLFHGIVTADDGLHARFNRSAALMAADLVRQAIARGVQGSASGLLRLEARSTAPEMRALLDRLGLAPRYLQALTADEASAVAGLPIAHPCWFYAEGGWVQPAGLAASFVSWAGEACEFQGGVEVQTLERVDSGWRLLNSCGHAVAEAQVVVLTNAVDALRLLVPIWSAGPAIDIVRGQISMANAFDMAMPHVPITGSGYLLPAIDGRMLFGATFDRGDLDPGVRPEDHSRNLAQLARLLGHPVALAPNQLEGRTGWRVSARDRLPLIGAVPDTRNASATEATRLESVRAVPRWPGLFMFTALGSRGITWSALGAQVLAAQVSGGPAPVAARLLEALDPARFVSRQARRASRE